MNYNVEATDFFKRQLKRLVKKFPSLKSEFRDIIHVLEENPEQGTPIGKNCYKIRLSITSKGKGKSGGARVITMYMWFVKLFICCQSMINLNKKTFRLISLKFY